MPTRLFASICTLLVLAVLAFASSEAEAARIGGGRSFGGKPSMSKPYTQPAPSTTMRQQTNPAQQPAAAAAAPGRGLFGGMGGMLGGLLAGTLLGSLLFGGGFSGGGFMDILLIGILLFLGFKLFARRKSSQQAQNTQNTQNTQQKNSPFQTQAEPLPASGPASLSPSQTNDAQPLARGGFDWGALSNTPGGGSASAQAMPSGPKLPPGFDEEDFLRGAKAAYTRLNASWDKRDFDDLTQFVTPSFVKELRSQALEDKNPGNTEILLVNASLLEVSTIDDEQIAQVYFDVLLREDPSQDTPVNVREVWHFARPDSGSGLWRLDGIQQVEPA